MSTDQSMIIVGASLAGAKAAEALREQGYDGRLLLIGEEHERPYERPPLSKDYLQGASEREKIFVHPEHWYADNNVELRLDTRVGSIDPNVHTVTLSDESELEYSKLLLTTGSSPRLLPTPGVDLDRVFYLREVEDSDRLKAMLGTIAQPSLDAGAGASTGTTTSAPRIIVIGAGWIGLEVTAAARMAGIDVTVIEMAQLPLLRVLGTEVAQVFADLHREHGVDLRFGAKITSISGDGASPVTVVLEDGSTIVGEAIVIGVGITPNIALAEKAGLEIENGIKVDEHLRTSDPDIFAAGDVANAYHPILRKHIRVEHWYNALHQPAVAATSMLAGDAVYEEVPYFFTDQYDLGMEYAGYVEPGGYDEVIFRGDKNAREFVVFWLQEGRVLAGMNVNIWDVNDQIKALVSWGQPVDRARLANPEVPLDELLQQQAPVPPIS